MALNNEFKVKNDLNTLGRILSGGTDLTAIFSPSNTSWTLSATNGNFVVAGGDTLGIQGGNGVDVRANVGTETVTISGINATTTSRGVASFNSASFDVTSGDVTIKTGGVSNAQLAGSITDDKLNTITSAGKVANSATSATSNNTANAIVARGASGEFSAGNITSSDTIQANAVVATNVLSGANTFTRQLSVGNVLFRTTGTSNVFIGNSTTGRVATTGSHNFVFGLSAGNGLTSGSNNSFIGNCAGRQNTTGAYNNFFGTNAGFSNTIGDYNNFFGTNAGFSNTAGAYNNIIGNCAGLNNTTGNNNNFLGNFVGFTNTTGAYNNFFGTNAGFFNTTGACNNFIGHYAGCANATGSNNTIIGNNANVATGSLSGVIAIGTRAVATESHQIVLSTANVVFRNIGNTFEIGAPNLTDNLTVFGTVSSTGIVNTNTGFRINNAATSGHVLRGNGTNFVSSTLAASDITSGQSLTKTDDTNVTLTLGGSPSTALLAAASLTLGWSGQLAVARGGTGSNNGSITGTGALTFAAGGSNEDINLTPSGSGEVNIPRVDIDAGTIDGVTIGGTTAATSISSALLNVDSIRVDGNTISSTDTNGNIVIAPNGTGDVQLDADTIRVGDSGATATVTTNGTGNLTLNTNGGTNSGVVTINQGTNGNIELTPDGSGSVVIPRTTISGGTINNTTIGLTTPASAVFTGVSVAGNVSISGNLFVAGSATQINTVDLVVKDPIIFLAEGNVNDTVDIGFTGAYNHNLTPRRHTGLVRDNTSKKWTLFSGLSTEILSATQIPFDDPSIVIDTLVANVEGTLTGNVSGVAAQAARLQTGRTISTTGDVTYTSTAFDGSANVTGTATIANDAVTTAKILNNNVTYAKLQQASANTILGNPTGSTANVTEISCTAAGRALLSAANVATQRNTLGLGTADSVTFGEVIVNNGTRLVASDVYNGTTSSGNTLTLPTFANASYNSAKFTVQIKNTNTNARCALEVIATKDNTTWEGTVYGIVDPSNIFTNIDIGVTGSTVDLAFTFNGVSNYTVTVYSQAISD